MKPALILAFIVYAFVSLLYITKTPPAWVDDYFYTVQSYHIVQAGKLNDEKLSPELFRGIMVGNLSYYFKSAFIKILGLSHFSSRIPSYLLGMASLILLYNIALRMFDKWVAFFASCYLAFSWKFVFASHDSRLETSILFFTLLVFWLYLKRVRWEWLALVSIISLEFHPAGLYIIIFMTLLMLHDKKFCWRYFFIVFLCIVYWFITHVLFNLEVFWVQKTMHHGNQMPSILNPSIILSTEFHRYYSFFWEGRYHRNMVLLATFIWTLVSFIPTKNRKLLLISLLSMGLFFVFFGGNGSITYFLSAFVFMLILISSTLDRRVLWGLFVFFLLEFTLPFYVYRGCNYEQFIDRISKCIVPGATVYGEPTYWIGMIARGYKYSDFPGFNGHLLYIKKTNPDYIVYNRKCFLWKNNFMDKYLNSKYKLIDKVADDFFGGDNLWTKGKYETEIYKKK